MARKLIHIIGIDEAGRAARKTGEPRPNYIIGIDEVGRGPLAGPVVVAGVKLELGIRNYELGKRGIFRGIKDSKKLSLKKREEWFEKITGNSKIEWAVAKVWPKMIDRINISQAANLGALRVYRKLSKGFFESRFPRNVIARSPELVEGRRSNLKNNLSSDQGREHTLLDGGLKLPLYISHETIIKGDEKIPVISAASIIAKVTRDRLMLRLHTKYPKYRFDVHKGYPTKLHKKLIKKYGRSEIHRKSFRSA